MQTTIPSRSKEPLDELDRYLKVDVEDVKDPITHWNDSKKLYPRLSQMALDYHAIPRTSIHRGFVIVVPYLISYLTATSVEVERVFSQGRLLLSHVRSALSPATTHTVLCLGQWSLLELVHKDDLEAVAQLPELDGDDFDGDFEDKWGELLPGSSDN